MSSTTKPKGMYGAALQTLLSAPRIVFVLAIVLFTFDMGLLVANRLRPIVVVEGITITIALGLLRVLMRSWLRPGYLRAIAASQTGDDLPLDSAVPPLGAFSGALIVNVLTEMLCIASMIVGALPGLVAVLVCADRHIDSAIPPLAVFAAVGAFFGYMFAWLGARFGEFALALEGYGPLRALSRAWSLARGHRLELFQLQLFASAVELLSVVVGIVCFVIGIFIAVPAGRIIGDHAHVAMYRTLLRRANARDLAIQNGKQLDSSGVRDKPNVRAA